MRNRRKAVLLTVFICVTFAMACAVLAAAGFVQLEMPDDTTINDFGAAAAAHGWPVRTPADQRKWPDATQWSEHSRFGYVHLRVSSAINRQSTHQMQIDRHGWPFTVFERRQLWWPWDDPTWTSAQRPDSGLCVRWDGVLLNGLVLGLPLAMLILAPQFLRARSRRRRGCCVECGYDLRGPSAGSPVVRCPECGTVSEPSATRGDPSQSIPING